MKILELSVRQLKSQKELKTHQSMCMDTLEQLESSKPIVVKSNTTATNSSQANIILNNNLNELNLQQQQQKSLSNGYCNNNSSVSHPNPVTPSLRVAALNLVGDALRKVTVSSINAYFSYLLIHITYWRCLFSQFSLWKRV